MFFLFPLFCFFNSSDGPHHITSPIYSSFRFILFWLIDRSGLFVSLVVAMHPHHLCGICGATKHQPSTPIRPLARLLSCLELPWCSDMNQSWWSLSGFSSPCGPGVWNTLQHFASSWILIRGTANFQSISRNFWEEIFGLAIANDGLARFITRA
jgi:hypothetical protein